MDKGIRDGIEADEELPKRNQHTGLRLANAMNE